MPTSFFSFQERAKRDIKICKPDTAQEIKYDSIAIQ